MLFGRWLLAPMRPRRRLSVARQRAAYGVQELFQHRAVYRVWPIPHSGQRFQPRGCGQRGNMLIPGVVPEEPHLHIQPGPVPSTSATDPAECSRSYEDAPNPLPPPPLASVRPHLFLLQVLGEPVVMFNVVVFMNAICNPMASVGELLHAIMM